MQRHEGGLSESIVSPPSLAVLAAQLAPLLGVAVQTLSLTPRLALPHQRQMLIDVRLPERHCIAKVFRPVCEQPDPATCEYHALQLVAPLDLAPKPVSLLPPLPPQRGAVVVYEFMPGVMWDRTPPSAGQLAQLAESWLRIHAIEPAGMWEASNTLLADDGPARFAALLTHYEQWAEAHFPSGRAVVAHCRAWAAQRHAVWEEVVRMPFVPVFCRSDPRFANFLQRLDGRLGMLDWERSGLRDPALDVASLLTHPNQEDLLTPQQWRAFLDPYLAEQTRHDPSLPARIHQYLAIFPMLRLAQFLQQGMERAARGTLAGWTINDVAANVRM